MKSRKFNNKLVLKKKTVANLESEGMKRIVGGGPDPASLRITGCTCSCGTVLACCPTI